MGVLGPGGAALNSSPLNYGLPNVSLGSIAGLSEVQPSFSLSQTISLYRDAELDSRQAQHALRRRLPARASRLSGRLELDRDFTFSGSLPRTKRRTRPPVRRWRIFCLGLPQETAIDAAASKSYLRDNVWDLYAQDDWRARSNLTLNYGLRYEFFAPYTEKYGHLAFVDTNAAGGFTDIAEVQSGSPAPQFSGSLPKSLVFPFRVALAPRLGVALRLPKQTVLRARLRDELHGGPIRQLCLDHGAAADGGCSRRL